MNNERIRHLRVRIKELASEAQHIRHEERQCSGMEKWRLQHHRKTVVRDAARAYQLAYACLRGVPYADVERSIRLDYKAHIAVREAKDIAVRFGGTPEDAAAWHADATTYLVESSSRPNANAA